ncbi:MAG: uracil-DNA glycosylase [Elusimicrobia bacterium]|nr:uracil-DNA glycosylase [Elusimicrobiota bacterium]
MNYFNKTVGLTKKYIEQLRDDGVADVISSGKGVSVKKSGKVFNRNTEDSLLELSKTVRNCKKCPLSKSRKNAVFGEGNPRAKLMFVGEGPGFHEDRLGRPFVGRAGQLLDKIIDSMGLKRDDVYIANIVKCHPMIDPGDPDKRGNDRKPSPDEMSACISYLEKQIKLISPKVICALGNVSATVLTGVEAPIGKLRGRFYEYSQSGIRIMPTYHPAALLRNPNLKRDTWEDIKKIMKELK